jgi:thiol-disulfide isomerase/thioredoxin
MNTLWIVIGILLLVLVVLLFAFPSTKTSPPSLPTVPLQAVNRSIQLPSKELNSEGPSKVVELQSNDDVEKFTSEGPGILLVYAPWCGHCKHMMPFFDQASTQTNVKFARIEGAKAPAFMNKHQVRGFPTIFLVNANKTVTRHMGGRDVSSLLAASALASSTTEAPVTTPPSNEGTVTTNSSESGGAIANSSN